MVTLDKIIESVPEFDGNINDRMLDYERAKQGLESLDSAYGTFEKSLKALTGFDEMHIPSEEKITEVTIGNVDFKIVSTKGILRPAYKSAVEQFENRLLGMTDIVSHGKAITGIVKRDDTFYVEPSWLRDDFEITVSGILIPGTKHIITYGLKGGVDESAPIQLTENLGLLNNANASNFVLMNKRRENLEMFVKSYEAALKKEVGRKEKDIVPVTSDAGYQVKKSTSKGPDWKYVVTTLMLVPTEKKSVGELYILADENVSMKDKRQLPTYDVWLRASNSGIKLYVSIPSVYERIQELKGEETIRARRLSIQRKDIV